MLVRVPSAGSCALNDGAQTIVNSGTCSRYASWPDGVLNMLRTNRLCHACSVTIRIGSLYSGCAHASRSWTNRSRPWTKPVRRPRISSNLPAASGRLYSPHQTLSSDDGSRTMNLSCAAREECLPVLTATGPPLTIRPSPRNAISSYSASAGRFQ